MKTKLFTLLLAVTASVGTMFAEKVQIGDLYYNLDATNLTAEVTSKNSGEYSGDVVIPASVEYNFVTYTVTRIGNNAFSGCSSLTSVTIPNSVTSIGGSAFLNCSGLTSVIFPNSVTSIGRDAFSNCSRLTMPIYNAHMFVYMPSSFSGIYSIPIGIESIQDDAFRGCVGLISISIPNSVTSIGRSAFNGCTGLTSVIIPSSVTSIGDHAFSSCRSLISVTIPNSVTSIGNHAFYGCSGLTSIEIPNSVTSIENKTFCGCSGLISVTILNSVTSIGERAFSGCSSLTSVTIPNSVTSIGNEAFTGCTVLTYVEASVVFFDIPETSWPSYTKILNNVIVNGGELTENALLFINRSYKTLQTLDVSGVSNTVFADEAFKGYYNLQQLVLPEGLQKVGYMMVAECVNLQSIEIPASVTKIEQRAFENCRSIRSVNFGENPSLTKIGNWAFFLCIALEELEIPEGVTEIGDGAFYGCAYLKNLVLPNSVQSIGDNTFALCGKLEKMTVRAVTPPDIDNKTFDEVSREIPVYVPDESVAEYQNHPLWREFFIQGISNLPTSIDNTPFLSKENYGEARKMLRNGQIFILRGDKTYTLQGQEVK